MKMTANCTEQTHCWQQTLCVQFNVVANSSLRHPFREQQSSQHLLHDIVNYVRNFDRHCLHLEKMPLNTLEIPKNIDIERITSYKAG